MFELSVLPGSSPPVTVLGALASVHSSSIVMCNPGGFSCHIVSDSWPMICMIASIPSHAQSLQVDLIGGHQSFVLSFFFFLESALFTVISLLYVLTTVTKCQIAGDLPSALFDTLKPGRSPE